MSDSPEVWDGTTSEKYLSIKLYISFQVIFGDMLLDYEQWPCKEASTSETSMCYGACLSTVLLRDDFWSRVTGARTPGSLRYVHL